MKEFHRLYSKDNAHLDIQDVNWATTKLPYCAISMFIYSTYKLHPACYSNTSAGTANSISVPASEATTHRLSDDDMCYIQLEDQHYLELVDITRPNRESITITHL